MQLILETEDTFDIEHNMSTVEDTPNNNIEKLDDHSNTECDINKIIEIDTASDSEVIENEEVLVNTPNNLENNDIEISSPNLNEIISEQNVTEENDTQIGESQNNDLIATIDSVEESNNLSIVSKGEEIIEDEDLEDDIISIRDECLPAVADAGSKTVLDLAENDEAILLEESLLHESVAIDDDDEENLSKSAECDSKTATENEIIKMDTVESELTSELVQSKSQDTGCIEKGESTLSKEKDVIEIIDETELSLPSDNEEHRNSQELSKIDIVETEVTSKIDDSKSEIDSFEMPDETKCDKSTELTISNEKDVIEIIDETELSLPYDKEEHCNLQEIEAAVDTINERDTIHSLVEVKQDTKMITENNVVGEETSEANLPVTSCNKLDTHKLQSNSDNVDNFIEENEICDGKVNTQTEENQAEKIVDDVSMHYEDKEVLTLEREPSTVQNEDVSGSTENEIDLNLDKNTVPAKHTSDTTAKSEMSQNECITDEKETGILETNKIPIETSTINTEDSAILINDDIMDLDEDLTENECSTRTENIPTTSHNDMDVEEIVENTASCKNNTTDVNKEVGIDTTSLKSPTHVKSPSPVKSPPPAKSYTTPAKDTITPAKDTITPAKDTITPAKDTILKDKPIICRLSNTLDIFSDEEEEEDETSVDPLKAETSQAEKSKEKQCIDIEDDDVIMVLDEEKNKNSTDTGKETGNKEEIIKELNVVNTDSETGEKTVANNIVEDNEEPKQTETSTSPNVIRDTNLEIDINEKPKKTIDEKQKDCTPLIPQNFLNTAKTKLSDMTREDLEEFCILKIVESIVDRSSLSDIKNKLQEMVQGLEEYRKKAMMLTKQNRDLQVVLKSIQEEQKKFTGEMPITPLKITRSVGVQVFMEIAPPRKKVTQPINNNRNANTPQNKNINTPGRSSCGPPKPNNQNIPVPRLVPAANNPALKSPSTIPQLNQMNMANKNATTQNGIRNPSPSMKAEKRPHSKIASNETVDLTDDEPAQKMPGGPKTSHPAPVRLIPSQNLIATQNMPTQRPPFVQGTNCPRKVYIPIGGPANQPIRAGQTIMLKTVSAPGMRPRCPTPMRINRLSQARHPAPLPFGMKQYQPPNWKPLPPAPDVKLSKVENGIVISWKIEDVPEDSYEKVASYQLFAYQETTLPPSTSLWKKIGDVKALPLPMACTLTQFMAGFKYYFAVRAVDIKSRVGPFSLPGSILLLNKHLLD